MAEEKKRRSRRIIYYPLEKNKDELEEVTPKPVLIRRESRPYLFPIIGQIIELIMQIIQARIQTIRNRTQTGREYTLFPKTMVREVVRDEQGRIIEERFEVYGGGGSNE